jgi:hypothetical protein
MLTVERLGGVKTDVPQRLTNVTDPKDASLPKRMSIMWTVMANH